MIAPHRLSVKFFFEELSIDVEDFIPVFHRWIRENVVPNELLLDVADYKHIVDGPAILLVGHEADYVVDLTDAKPGLMYVRKRDAGSDLSEALGTTLSQALNGVKLTESDVELKGKLKLRTDAATIVLLDRLNYANAANGDGADTAAAAALSQISDNLAPIFGDDTTVTRVANDPREPLTFELSAPSAPDVDTLLSQLGSAD
ncbi:MAG: hypothetical protein F4Z82_01705 [Caldilineaceae bacterium SB0668_bin_21]|nr:hypothetical protein [Caldilineaceae bacterium SB0668_bin_21]MYC21619.1 hypothetical protein [Caldilineaceae bacterium SB0662_bin_25]